MAVHVSQKGAVAGSVGDEGEVVTPGPGPGRLGPDHRVKRELSFPGPSHPQRDLAGDLAHCHPDDNVVLLPSGALSIAGEHDRGHTALFEQGSGKLAPGSPAEQVEGPVKVCLACPVAAHDHRQLPRLELDVGQRPVIAYPVAVEQHEPTVAPGASRIASVVVT
jgi:hypothetical protein